MGEDRIPGVAGGEREMIEPIPGHDPRLDPPAEREHLPACDFHMFNDPDDCCCDEMSQAEAESAAEDQAMEEYYAEKYGA